MKLGPMAALAVGLAIASNAHATIFIVDATDSALAAGGLPSISLTLGEAFTVTSSTNDLWSAGDGPLMSDGDGLIVNRFATASDDSGEAVGTQIGSIVAPLTQGGLTAPYGSLVGELGGVYEELGANFAGAAWGTGTLNLFFWDINGFDNAGSIAFDIKPVSEVRGPGGVPEPASWALMITGFGAAGAMLRRRRTAALAV
jgi:hypothetical protein